MERRKILSLSMITAMITSGTIVATALDNQKIIATEDEKSKINIISDIGFDVKAPIDLYLESPVELILETEEFYYSGTTVDRVISIPDANLRQEIAWQLGKYDNEELYKSDLEQLEFLYAGYRNISDLEGLQYATNLKVLGLGDNKINDITQLSNLVKLESLYLGWNKITDLKGIENLYSLKELDLSSNQIVEIHSVSGLRNLEQLNLNWNKVNDSGPLKELDYLKILEISNNQISDITNFESLNNLEKLDISNNQIKDISILSKLTSLAALDLSYNPVSNLEVIRDLKKLEELSLYSVNVENIGFLSGLTNLKSLSLSNTEINDFTPISNLINLECLILPSTGFSNMEILNQLVNLKELDLSGNNIENADDIERFKELTTLSLNANKINNIESLSSLSHLEALYLYENKINDISSLSRLTELRWLDLSYNEISNISPLNQLDNLQNAWLYEQTINLDDIIIENPQDVTLINPLRDLNNNYIHNLTFSEDIKYNDENNEFIFSNVMFNKKYEIFFSDKIIQGFNEWEFSGKLNGKIIVSNPINQIIDIPDENLKSAINSTLGNEWNEPIQLADLKQLDYLYGGYYEITSLEGLEHATNLKELYLSNNYITDVTPLRELENLKHLDLSNNSIQDISILEQEILTSLNYLNLSGNQIENLSSLATYNNLYSLYISDNEISDITPLLNLSNLQSLDLSSNPIEDFSVLSEAKLNNLYDLALNNSFITDLECLKSLENLQTLSLNNTTVSDYSILKEFEHLQYLSLRENQFSNLTELQSLNHLYSLDLSANQINDISGIESFTQLHSLNLSNNLLTDISDLVKLDNLKYLYLSDNKISDFSAIGQLNLYSVLTENQYIELDKIIIENAQDIRVPNPLINIDGTPVTEFENLGHTQYDLSTNEFVFENVKFSKEYELNFYESHELPNQDIYIMSGNLVIPIEVLNVVDELVDIPDQNLKESINLQLDKEYDSDLYVSDLEQLEYLYASYQDITNLKGLQYAVNLKDLTLSYNQIEDISPLEDLKSLENLDLSGNIITDFKLISQFKNLKSLYLQNMNIEDISFLNSLTNLQTISLFGNNISEANIEKLYLPNLMDLNLDNNNISDISIFVQERFPGLGNLSLQGNKISNIENLEKLSHISQINLLSQEIKLDEIIVENPKQIRIANPIKGYKSAPMEIITLTQGLKYDEELKEFIVNPTYSRSYKCEFSQSFTLQNEYYSQWIDYSGVVVIPVDVLNTTEQLIDIQDENLKLAILNSLEKDENDDIYKPELEGLEYLHAYYYGISSLEGLQYAKNLKHLSLSGNNISDLQPLSNLLSLEGLDLSNNKIEDISALKQLDSLTDLDLGHNKIVDISSLKQLDSLTDLDLSNNKIEDISSLSNLTNLSSLILFGNEIEDISVLCNLTSLSNLNLWANKISDVSIFSKQGFESLDNLHLGDNYISDVSPLGKLEGSLTSLSLSNNEISDISFLSKLDLRQLRNIDLYGNNISDINILKDLTYNDYPFINLENQSIFIEEKEVEKGDSVSIDNPITSPDWGNISYDLNDGEYHSDMNQFIWNDLNKTKILTVQFNLDEEYSIPASILYSGKIRQRVNVICGEEENTLPSIYTDDLQIKLGQKLDLLEGVTAFDEQDGNVTQSLQIIDSNVDFTKPGVYRVVYSAHNLSGNHAKLERTITIVAEEEDLNQDGIINESDLDLLSTYYNVTSQDWNWKENYDLNQDGIIDLYDTVLISSKIQPINITSFEANLSQVILDYIVTDEKVGDVTIDLLLNGTNVDEISGFVSSTEETQIENENRHVWNFNDILQPGPHNIKVIIKQNGEEIVSQEINIIKNEISPITPLEFSVNNEYMSVSLQLDNFEDSTLDWEFYVNGIPTLLEGGGGGDGNGYVAFGGSLHSHLLPGENIVGIKINYTVDGVTHIMSLSKYLNK